MKFYSKGKIGFSVFKVSVDRGMVLYKMSPDSDTFYQKPIEEFNKLYKA